MGLRGLREGHGLVYHRSESASEYHFHHLVQLMASPAGGADQAVLTAEEGDDIEGHHLAAVPADSNDDAVSLEALQAFGKHLAAYVFHEHVHTFASG